MHFQSLGRNAAWPYGKIKGLPNTAPATYEERPIESVLEGFLQEKKNRDPYGRSDDIRIPAGVTMV